jgi:SPP1 gp7 family putative phage head morphogenesis protein
MAEISPAGFDATIRHATFLEQLKAGQARSLVPFLKEIDQAIRLRLSKGEVTEIGRARLERLLAAVDDQVRGILARFATEFRGELRELAGAEARFEARSLDNSIRNPRFEAVVPAPQKVLASALAAPLGVRGIHGGRLLDGFVKGWSESARELIVGRIRRGAFEGEPSAAIARAIRGTQALGFRDGTLAQVRRQSEAMVRTAVSHVSHIARLETFRANGDLVKSYRWLSTLDNRTSEICMGLSGEVFKVGDGPIPPAHVNCRSTIVAELDERFAFLEEGRKQASQFGPVDAKQGYFSWIKTQPAAFQDKVLGPMKGRLLRQGGLSPETFRKLTRSENFQPLTLREMERLEPLAFKRAGIRFTEAGVPVLEG